MKNTGTNGTVSTNYKTGVVTMFHPRFRYGFIKESKTGEDIHFRMDQCFKFECLDDSGPVFSDEYKDQWPKKGEMVIFIVDTEPVLPGMRPSVTKWNFADSFKHCLEDYMKKETGADKPVTQPQPKASNGRGHYHNSPRHTSDHQDVDVDYLPEWACDPKSPAPSINLAAEFRISEPSLERLARSVGGRNANTRKVHQAARNSRVQ